MSGFVVSYGKLDQSGFISGEISRPLREVNRMTFVVRVDGDEASTVHTLQLAEELKCGYFFGGGGTPRGPQQGSGTPRQALDLERLRGR